MEKSCNNCYFWSYPTCSCRAEESEWLKCIDNDNRPAWHPKHETLESQLAKANALIIEQIEQLAQYKEALRLACEHYQKKINCLELDYSKCSDNRNCVDCFVEYFLNKVKEAPRET